MTTQPYTLVSTDLEAFIGDVTPSTDRPQIKRLLQSERTTIIHLALAAGQVMREHSTNSPLTVTVMSGTIFFRIAGDEIVMPAGSVIHVAASELHELEAQTDAHMTLLLATAQ